MKLLKVMNIVMLMTVTKVHSRAVVEVTEVQSRAVDDGGECRRDQDCVHIVECSPVIDLLHQVVHDPEDSLFQVNMINVIRDRICGATEERKVCCPKPSLRKVSREINNYLGFKKATLINVSIILKT